MRLKGKQFSDQMADKISGRRPERKWIAPGLRCAGFHESEQRACVDERRLADLSPNIK